MEFSVESSLSDEEIRHIVDPQNTGTVAVTNGIMPTTYIIVVADLVSMVAVKTRLRAVNIQFKNIDPYEDDGFDEEDDQETDQYGDIIEW
jgi:hypothetical protein